MPTPISWHEAAKEYGRNRESAAEITEEIKEQPGSRRFRELLRREREDVAMLARNLSVIYDEITFGVVSKPNTDPRAVIQLYEERLDDEVAEERKDTIERIRAAIKTNALPPVQTDADLINEIDSILDAELAR